MQKNTISIDHNNKRILISRKNVSLTNNPDTSYINITKGRRSIIKIHMKKGYELIVNFTQYKTIKDKENNNPSFSITYVVEDLIELGLRTSTKCFDYYRNRIVVKNSKKKAINSNKEKAYKIYQEDCVKTIWRGN